MSDKEILKKQIIYRSVHRGTKELDILLGNFVKKYIDEFTYIDLKNLHELLLIEDEVLYQWFFEKKDNYNMPKNHVTEKLKCFKL